MVIPLDGFLRSGNALPFFIEYSGLFANNAGTPDTGYAGCGSIMYLPPHFTGTINP
jgi:hypothetical protein